MAKVIYLPAEEGGQKTGLDDDLRTGHSTDDLLRLATPNLRPMDPDEKVTGDSSFRATPQGILHVKQTQTGEAFILLTNFTATMVSEIEEDDGADTLRILEIEATLKGQMRRFALLADNLFSVKR